MGGSGRSPYGRREAGVAAYPGDLDTVQLLLPVQNRLHPVYPHVDVPDQHRLADSLHQRAQGRVEGLQQLSDEPDVLLVFEDLSGGEQSMSSQYTGTPYIWCTGLFSPLFCSCHVGTASGDVVFFLAVIIRHLAKLLHLRLLGRVSII